MPGNSNSGNTNSAKRDENNSLIALMYEAEMSPIGLLVYTNEPEKLVQRLWHLRNGELDEHPELSKLKFHPSPWPDEPGIVIVKVKEGESESEQNLPDAAQRLLDI